MTILSLGFTKEDNPLAFDHTQIIAQAFLRMLSFDIETMLGGRVLIVW